MRFDHFSKKELPSEQIPKDIDSLIEPERVARFSHQLGVMYDRIMITGDWEGEHLERRDTGNIFDDIHYVSNTTQLADGIDSFLAKSKMEIPVAINPEDLSEPNERRDFNRRLFVEVLKYTKDILRGGNKEQILELEKTIDENMTYFRDLPFPLPGGHGKFDTRKLKKADTNDDDWKAMEGLKRITDRIVASIAIAQLDEPPRKTL
ncbi:MAG: hypothetical protein Q7S50_04915 [bacterium]|nr:hypothetical protein [bacterium]